MSPFDDPSFVARFLDKRQSPKSVNNVLDTPTLMRLIGEIDGKTIVEIGCAAGDFCQGLTGTALAEYMGIDISVALLAAARAKIADVRFKFELLDVNVTFPDVAADIVVSGLTLHFVENIASVMKSVRRTLTRNGLFVFSIRHPFRTCNLSGKQDDGSWLVKDYFDEGRRTHLWHGLPCVLYHRTIATWSTTLTAAGFRILSLAEPLADMSNVLEEDLDHCTLPGALYFKCVVS